MLFYFTWHHNCSFKHDLYKLRKHLELSFLKALSSTQQFHPLLQSDSSRPRSWCKAGPLQLSKDPIHSEHTAQQQHKTHVSLDKAQRKGSRKFSHTVWVTSQFIQCLGENLWCFSKVLREHCKRQQRKQKLGFHTTSCCSRSTSKQWYLWKISKLHLCLEALRDHSHNFLQTLWNKY